jgi:hypothetical protein
MYGNNSRIHLGRLQNKYTNYKGKKNKNNSGQIAGTKEKLGQHVNKMTGNTLPRVMKQFSAMAEEIMADL